MLSLDRILLVKLHFLVVILSMMTWKANAGNQKTGSSPDFSLVKVPIAHVLVTIGGLISCIGLSGLSGWSARPWAGR